MLVPSVTGTTLSEVGRDFALALGAVIRALRAVLGGDVAERALLRAGNWPSFLSGIVSRRPDCYSGPAIETDVECDNMRPSSVQIAPVAAQSVVAGSVMVIAPLPGVRQ